MKKNYAGIGLVVARGMFSRRGISPGSIRPSCNATNERPLVSAPFSDRRAPLAEARGLLERVRELEHGAISEPPADDLDTHG